jgi:plasmid stabilization system protein ParE
MPRVEIALRARDDLDRLARTLSLPPDARERVRRSLRPLAKFPMLGPELSGRWAGLRFILGPWRWMLIVYSFLADQDRVVVVTIQDARSATGPRDG